MGLTKASTGAGAADSGLTIVRSSPEDAVIALAGNPNVGKSTVFNALTGMRQHTGNWPGKTVGSAQGQCEHGGRGYVLVDLPGTYSLMAHSTEEEVARDFLCFGGADGAVVVCDATCLERNLNLVLQTLELEPRTVVCVNLLDEAEKKGIRVDLKALSARLGVPVVGAAAARGEGLDALMDAVATLTADPEPPAPMEVRYLASIERAAAVLVPLLRERLGGRLPERWVALRLLDDDPSLLDALADTLDCDLRADEAVQAAVASALAELEAAGVGREALKDRIVSCLVLAAEDVCNDVVTYQREDYERRDRRLDKILTSRATGIPVMLLLLAGVFWLTITGANYPSQLLSDGLFWVQDRLTDLFTYFNAPDWLHGALVLGVYRVLAWVVSVMLPPMAIFFPIFTLLEDFGYLPRVAFVLDHAFQKAKACGKQALTMCLVDICTH
ncbi:ferrous iron transporter B [Lawsonibacter faecis]|uniref:Ferrous iron transporter B n=1 Tax=Lawsonibacter faecis TaxID=2763052 RepID=A0A8J6J6R7_9FIRM|nr:MULTISPECIES: ferrous iron transporter B [Oscillospiraceae]MTQ95254.1 ferrous iron transporter B [Pseudoflavonifractor sp. BIOML-A16]MTR07028.1 ferrous iron transporter B [Pseudoflavonifractor sp. BIOML-A15]MTR32266.1 ferrous iron transporter B [Pseudoflavonifractor sp. BIOML-A14]MTR72618.1 ferrous iron transporter B [Pseudoflavonifractor sp. BIOML-A18]MTS64111.1 ferrous iron transporter B [Pseudoflavonifractor sp. BIOML-A5]MTS70012.1 ferrous iron transporter B [Pseudoflavonifractor sp. BI